jgi:hypothetical protein
MNRKITVVILAWCFAFTAGCLANPQMGTWKLNEAKSKLAPGMGKNSTVIYQADGDNIKVTVNGIDAQGKANHSEWVGKFDGKNYPVTGDPDSDMRSYQQMDDHTLDINVMKDGKITMTGRIVVSADGKTRTINMHGTEPNGKKFHSMSIYDRE